MANPAGPNRRRKWVVDPKYQHGLTLRIVGLFVVFGILLLFLVRWACALTLNDLELQRDPVIPAVLQVVTWIVVIELSVFLPILALLCIRLSHRVVGPVDRIIRTLDQMAQGNLDVHLTLRKGDILQPLADAINRLIAAQRARRPTS